ncbi:MAG TPA: thioredoxin fold domain-containing protein [Burkholderiales bacterium]
MRAVAFRGLWLLVFVLVTGAARAAERDPLEHFFHPFLGDLREELATAKAAGKRGVMVMYHFDDCPACQKMKKLVLNQGSVQDWYRREFVVVGIDIRGAQPITGIDGKTLPEQAYGKAMAIRGTPSFDFYAPDGARTYRHTGGIFDPAEFLLLGQYVASGAYRTQTFAQYRQTPAKKGS